MQKWGNVDLILLVLDFRVSKLGKGTSLGTREKMWLRECRIVSGIKAWESHSAQVY